MATTFHKAPRGYPYSLRVQYYGGRPPYTWSISAGALPTGLTLDGYGRVTGTTDPTLTVGAVYNFTVKLVDGLGREATKAFAITITQGDDMPLPRLTYTSVTQVSVGAPMGDPSAPTFRCILQDNKERSIVGPLVWNITVAGQGGRDAGAEGISEWWYLYLVPQTAAPDTALAVIGSKTDPTTGGPTGYANYRYIGPVYNDAGGNLLAFYQRARDVFLWDVFYNIESIDAAGLDASVVNVDLAAWVPKCAAALLANVSIFGTGAQNNYLSVFPKGHTGGVDETQRINRIEAYKLIGAVMDVIVPITDNAPAMGRRRTSDDAAGPSYYRLRALGYIDGAL